MVMTSICMHIHKVFETITSQSIIFAHHNMQIALSNMQVFFFFFLMTLQLNDCTGDKSPVVQKA